MKKSSVFKLIMAAQPTDEELLACPEPVELRFIHRGKRDQIASCAVNKSKNWVPINVKNIKI